MHLKKLIVSGFKSFADKVVLNFDRGITGIVGPNGAGKSNVIDAVRWVMGEQNAKNLRGKIATDIIFAGAQKRQAMTMAEVTLIFDNSDFSSICPPEYRHEPEISLTRRLYIDGEREYLINKKPCRFKDIVSFFSTTGLGGRSYSMIQQGQVDRILNAKPEDVREILEEAAGTAFFKERAGAATRKLMATQENLKRIDDILAELNKQLETLKSQVDKAKEWKKLSDEMRDKELKLFVFNYTAYRDKHDSLSKQLEGETDKEVEYIGQISHLESRLLELRDELAGSDPHLEELRNQLQELSVNNAWAESTIVNALKSMDNGHKRLLEIGEELKREDQELAKAEESVDDAQRKMIDAQQELVRLSELLESFEDEVEQAAQAYAVYQNRIDDLAEEIKNLDNLLLNNGVRCEAIERDRKRSTQEMTGHQQRIAALEQELIKFDDLVKEKQQVVASYKMGLDTQVAEKQQREQAIFQRYQEIETLAAGRDTLKEEYVNVKARYHSISEMMAAASDIANDLATLKSSCPDSDTILKGILTDYIAFNKALGELPASTVAAFELWVEKVLVEDFNAFNELVRLAHKHKLGSLPVMVMSNRLEIDRQGIKKWAADCDAVPLKQFVKIVKSHPFIEYLLERLYHIPSLQLSQDEILAIPRGIVAFSGQGVIVSGHDDLFVGNRSTKGILSRKVELDELEVLIKERERELARAQNQLDMLDSKQNEDRLVIRDIDTGLKQQNKETLDAMGALQAVTQQRQNTVQLLEDAAAQYAKSEEHHFALTKDLEQLGQNRIALGQEREGLVGDLDALKEEACTVEDRNSELQRQRQNKAVDLAKLESRSQSLQEAYLASQERLERVQGSLSRRYEEKSRVEAEIEQAKIDETQCRAKMDVYLKRKEELDEQLSQKKEQNAGLLEEVRVLENKIRECRDKQHEIERLMMRKSSDLERIKVNIEHVTQQAFEKYQIHISTHQEKIEDNFNHDRVEQEIARIRSNIEKIGGVNMLAIGEYDRTFTRFNFITAQKDEVTGSIDLLEEAIFEIQDTAKAKFLSTFEVININYQELFPILFPGGQAHLQLTNPDDPLNGGVDIFARLPGKTTQHMTLFSGGEKALTAISLIFALLKTKPTPFCFLDEVDAPLDETNVGRYNNVLEALSNRFQFVVITHNRRTMEVLDQLYGVTMQEGGVSKVVGVDMNKDLPEHLRKAFKEPEKTREVQGASTL